MNWSRTFPICAVLVAFLPVPAAAAGHDVVIYGGTASGAAAAIQAARMGKSVILIEPSQHIGGLTSGGLGWTDSGNKAVIGGISREFYQRVKKHYDNPAAWTFQKPEQNKQYRPQDDAMWTFEPKVAEAVLRDMLAEHKIECVFGERLNRTPGKGVHLDGKRIVSLTTESGKTYSGKVFLDATYEGDLMAVAGVSYTTGRESNAKYNETLNGVARKWQRHSHYFYKQVDPYVKPGDPSSGLIFGIEKELPADGEGDHRLQAYCYRMCLTNVPENRVPFVKPEGYDESRYELLFRSFEAGDLRLPLSIGPVPNGKSDTNNNCAFSTDYIGQNYKYPEASYAERDAILKDHLTYQQGLMWSLANHPRVPESIRKRTQEWGHAKDEFVDTHHWSHQIYVREARRMVGGYVQTELDCRRLRDTPKSVGMGSYNMDSHNCARYVTPEGYVQNEGDVQESPGGPYRISYDAIVPQKGECPNLLVPVCVSSSHIAYGSIRMEPVFMILGQSAATAAALAIDAGVSVQDVSYDKLREHLLKDKQVLEYAVPPKLGVIDLKKLTGIVVDDEDAVCVGFNARSSAMGPYVGQGYRHDEAQNRGKQKATYTPKLPTAGTYEVRLCYSPNGNRASNVPVTILHADGESRITVNQKKVAPIDKAWLSIGKYRFESGKKGSVIISNTGANGHVIIDAVQFIPMKD